MKSKGFLYLDPRSSFPAFPLYYITKMKMAEHDLILYKYRRGFRCMVLPYFGHGQLRSSNMPELGYCFLAGSNDEKDKNLYF